MNTEETIAKTQKTNPRQTLGAQGEQRAADWMLARGWRVLERNYRKKSGEIDIIAMDGDVLVMAEVKTRTRVHETFGGGERAVNHKKRQRIIRTTLKWMELHGYSGPKRYDIIEWTVNPPADLVCDDLSCTEPRRGPAAAQDNRWHMRWIPAAFRQWRQSDDWRYYDNRFFYNDASGQFEFCDE